MKTSWKVLCCDGSRRSWTASFTRNAHIVQMHKHYPVGKRVKAFPNTYGIMTFPRLKDAENFYLDYGQSDKIPPVSYTHLTLPTILLV